MGQWGGSTPGKASASKKTVRAAEQERPDVAQARAAWKDDQKSLDPAKLVFIDETGTNTKMARLYGRSKHGQRVIGRVPWGHWKTVTVVAGLRQDAITAPFVIDCAINAPSSLYATPQSLAPPPHPAHPPLL